MSTDSVYVPLSLCLYVPAWSECVYVLFFILFCIGALLRFTIATHNFAFTYLDCDHGFQMP